MIAGGIVFVLLVGTCRMYLGMHYPTDILAGWMLALAWVSALAMLFDPRYLAIGTPRDRAATAIAPAIGDAETLSTTRQKCFAPATAVS